jgi:hypothetical protein
MFEDAPRPRILGTWGIVYLQVFFSQGYVLPCVSLWALHGTGKEN